MGLTREMLRDNRNQFISDSIKKFESQCMYGEISKTIIDRFKNYGCKHVGIELEFCSNSDEITNPTKDHDIRNFKIKDTQMG